MKIRRAKSSDLIWMAEKSLPKFNAIYSEEEKQTVFSLRKLLERALKGTYVVENKAYISTIVSDVDNSKVMWIDAWFSETPGLGMALFKHITKLARRIKAIQTARIHKAETAIYKFAIKRLGCDVVETPSGNFFYLGRGL